ncbi:MAG: M23 family metallopeptidase [Lysobacteraceae bacterium]|nr:MAG: M23 family metallopeptidase [Xanthomonadaceae bacterium]
MDRRARRSVAVLLAVATLAGLALCWTNAAMLQAVPEAFRLWRMPAPTQLPVPVQGIRAKRIADTWGGPRSGGRSHQGTDIFAARGTPVRSATPGIVLRIGDHGIGGKHVWVLGPGGERHYYAHLDGWAAGVHRYQVMRTGDALGAVGDSGNARGTPPHLHYGIYAATGALNPHPRLRDAATE